MLNNDRTTGAVSQDTTAIRTAAPSHAGAGNHGGATTQPAP